MRALNKKHESFSKVCSIAMTDITKRTLFGNANISSTIKIEVTARIQYSIRENSLIQSHSLPKGKLKEIKKPDLTSSKVQGQSTVVPQKQQIKKEQNKVGVSKGSARTEQKKKTKEDDEDFEFKDISVIDELMLKEIKDDNGEFGNFVEKYIEKYPLDAIKSYSDAGELSKHIKDVIAILFDYQKEYYEKFKSAVALNNQLKEFLVKYHEKLRLVIKKHNNLAHQEQTNLIKKHILSNVRRNDNKQVEDLLSIRNKELNLYKFLIGNNFTIEEAKNNDIDDINKDSNTQLLLQICRNVTRKYGALDKLVNTNKFPVEGGLAREVVDKFKNELLVDNNEVIKEDAKYKEGKGEFVLGENLDENDIKVDNYLCEFYSKSKGAKVHFNKIGKNTYEFGIQKITVKIEKDNSIKVKYLNGFIPIDKFLEANANLEEMRLKVMKKPNNKIKIKSKGAK